MSDNEMKMQIEFKLESDGDCTVIMASVEGGEAFRMQPHEVYRNGALFYLSALADEIRKCADPKCEHCAREVARIEAIMASFGSRIQEIKSARMVGGANGLH